MGLNKSEYDQAREQLQNVKKDALAGEGHNEEFLGTLYDAYEREPQAATKELTELGNKREDFGRLEEHFRLTIEPKLEALRVEEPSLTAYQKAAALRSLGYMLSNIDYTKQQTRNVPSMHTKAIELETKALSLEEQVTADPPPSSHTTRHRRTHRTSRTSTSSFSAPPTASRRGLSPRARRRE